MARYTYTIEIAGVASDKEAEAFAAQVRAMDKVVHVEHCDTRSDCPSFLPLVVHPDAASFEGGRVGFAICFLSKKDGRNIPEPLLWSPESKQKYEFYLAICGGELDPTKLDCDLVSDYANACFYWVRHCMRELGCNDKGLFTHKEALAALPKLNWALLHPGKEIP